MAMRAEMADPVLREGLLERRHKLEQALPSAADPEPLRRLLVEVDDALGRMDAGTYGLCEVCHDPVEPERLASDPLVRLCLDHLSAPQQRALEEDLELAARIQRRLLPEGDHRGDGWSLTFRYESAGIVGGDYCDILRGPGGGFVFAVGDVSGKGIAASMLMASLQATFRTLVSVGIPLHQIAERASRLLCESTLPNQYATCLFGCAGATGEVSLCNAGHLPPLLVRGDTCEPLTGGGLPLGMFCESTYGVRSLRMASGDSLLLYTDGVTESLARDGSEFGRERLASSLRDLGSLPEGALLSELSSQIEGFRGGAPRRDDLTVLLIRRIS